MCVHVTNVGVLSADLSFNNIPEVGTGLQALVNLRDLSLAHNQLTDISGFQNLCQLQSLSLASNKLDTLEQVQSTRLMSRYIPLGHVSH